MKDIQVETLQKLVQFNTISGAGVSSGSYVKCASFLADRCASIGLSVQQFDLVKGKPIVIATRRGLDPTLPSLLLTGVIPFFNSLSTTT
jgi:acetylornithine deacetylase/succinyl-diaminopimelate desuccinylase-like protein